MLLDYLLLLQNSFIFANELADLHKIKFFSIFLKKNDIKKGF